MLGGLTASIGNLPGVGPGTAARLTRLGIRTWRDLLLHLPRDYQDWSRFARFSETAAGELYPVLARVTGQARRPLKGGRRSLLTIRLECSGETGSLVCFNRDYLARQLVPGLALVVYGRFEYRFGEWQCAAFEYEVLEDDEPLAGRGLVPVYPSTAGLTQRVLRRLVQALFARCGTLPESLPAYLRERRRLPPLDTVLRRLHAPGDRAELAALRTALAYTELFLFEAAILFRRLQGRSAARTRRYRIADPTADVQKAFGFMLTAGQGGAIRTILADLAGARVMQRLLLGDVGSGKTAVAAAIVLVAVRSGFQAAVAAPTGILADQLYRKFSGYLGPLGVRCAFLSGATAVAERRRLLEALAAGQIDLLVGTHALFSDDVVFRELALVVIDEQHRFGVNHRRALLAKGRDADYLAMSATPIPRSLALSLYGDFELVRIPDVPGGRGEITTLLFDRNRDEAYALLEERLHNGEQAYIVFPLIEENEGTDLAAAVTAYEQLAAGPLGRFGMALLHGRLPDAEKERVMHEFQAGRAAVLVSTTVIEVGIDNPRATVILIEDARRFGLSQLHQLRGRVGRGTAPAWCLLVGGGGGEEAAARLAVLLATRDGFRIAEEDLRLRGPGDYFGVQQSGVPEFACADLVRDVLILERARRDAHLILRRDPELADSHNDVLREGLAPFMHDGGAGCG